MNGLVPLHRSGWIHEQRLQTLVMPFQLSLHSRKPAESPPQGGGREAGRARLTGGGREGAELESCCVVPRTPLQNKRLRTGSAKHPQRPAHPISSPVFIISQVHTERARLAPFQASKRERPTPSWQRSSILGSPSLSPASQHHHI